MQEEPSWDPKEIGDEPSEQEQLQRATEVIGGATVGIDQSRTAGKMGTAGAGSEIGGEDVEDMYR
jgi:hypothetical protein